MVARARHAVRADQQVLEDGPPRRVARPERVQLIGNHDGYVLSLTGQVIALTERSVTRNLHRGKCRGNCVRYRVT